jgi:carbamate kinase
LARELDADLFVMATDVEAVYEGWGTPEPVAIGRVTLAELRGRRFAAGSMGPKVEAAIDFVTHTGRRAAIGTLAQVEQLVAGTAGTNVVDH